MPLCWDGLLLTVQSQRMDQRKANPPVTKKIHCQLLFAAISDASIIVHNVPMKHPVRYYGQASAGTCGQMDRHMWANGQAWTGICGQMDSIH